MQAGCEYLELAVLCECLKENCKTISTEQDGREKLIEKKIKKGKKKKQEREKEEKKEMSSGQTNVFRKRTSQQNSGIPQEVRK